MKNKKAFSLVEIIVALSLFAIAGFVISSTCYNLILPFSKLKKDSYKDINIQMCLDKILEVSNYEDLDNGIDVDSLDGQTCRVYGYFEQTEILDLFELTVKIIVPSSGSEIERKLLVIRPSWYENKFDRDDLKKNRTDFLEDIRREKYFNRKK